MQVKAPIAIVFAAGGIAVKVLLLVACLSFLPLLAVAQPMPVEPGTPTALEQFRKSNSVVSPEVARDLVARLSDSEVRQLLLERLDALANGKDVGDANFQEAVVALERNVDRVHGRLREMSASIVDLPAEVSRAFGRFRDNRPLTSILKIGLLFALMMLVGWIAERIFRHLSRNARNAIVSAEPDRLMARLGYLVLRFGLDVAAIGVFVVAAVALFFIFFQGHEMTRTTVMAYLAAVALVRLFSTVSRFLLSPRDSSLRLVGLDDGDTAYLHRQGEYTAIVAAFGFLTCSLLGILGIERNPQMLLVIFVGAVMTGLIAYTIWRARKAISGDLRNVGATAGRVRTAFADVWPYVALSFTILYYCVVVLLVLADVKVSYLAFLGNLAVVLLLPHVDALLERTAQSQLRVSHDSNEIQAVAVRALRIVLAVTAILFVFQAWGVDLFSLAEQSIGNRLADVLFDIGIILLVSYMLWEAARITIDRVIAEETVGDDAAEAGRGDEGGVGASRLATLLPLIRGTIRIAIMAIAVMLVLSALGVSIGPLLAGAGIVGIAIGFGAQTLVRDIVSGAFFLLDDAFRTGEYIDIGSVKGMVERISIRSIRLRHHLGPLHTIPFGEIQFLTNLSRDWVIMKLEFRVTYDTDIQKVKKIFKQIGQELMDDPLLGPGFIQPFKSQGVKAMEDSAIIMRGKFMAKPGQQFMIRKELYMRIQKAFHEQGIKFAHRRVAVDLPSGVEPTSEQGKALAEAAAAAIEDEAAKA